MSSANTALTKEKTMAYPNQAANEGGNYGAALRGAGQAPPNVLNATPTELGSLHARLIKACGEVGEATDRVRRVADAVLGQRGEEAGGSAPTPVPSGILQEIEQTVDRLFLLVAENDRQASRLSNLA